MSKLWVVLCLFLSSLSVDAQTPAADAAYRQQINAFIDQWHDDAAHARPAYFDKIAKDGIYIGTDKSELWNRDAFKIWAKPYFDKGKAWAFTPLKRNVYWSPDHRYVWFDEQLQTQMGICQASGVIHQTSTGALEIEHYQLSIAIPNPLAEQVRQEVHAFETQADGK